MSNDNPFPDAAPDFSDPLGLLRACHQRILGHCDTLERLIEHVAAQGVDSEARQAARKVHHYFSTAGRLHHQDEEVDLFPYLARQSLKLADVVHRLKQDHRAMDETWENLEPYLAKPGSMADDDAGFTAAVEAFNRAYRDHIAREESDLLDIAVHILGSDQLKTLGNAMAERRGQLPRYI